MPPLFSHELSEPTLFPSALDFQKRTSPCEAACPAGVPIQKMNELIRDNRMEEALQFVRSRNPFSTVTGRVCSHPCEEGCNRNRFDEGLSIRALERYASDHADRTAWAGPRRQEATGKKIAVIGSGPAGMTCAYFSALFGHQVTVFEASPLFGGMPRIGIPDFRLPKHIVDREIGQVLALGVTARANTAVGRDVTLEALRAQYDACLIATGAWKERPLGLPGADLAVSGLSFLKEVNAGRRDRITGTVAVIGGGGVAFDCAFTARRLGAKAVHILCVEKAGEMCAGPDDLRQGREEGLTVHDSTMVSRLLPGRSGAAGVEFFEITGFHFDECRKLTVQALSDRKKILEADTVISAVGVEPDLSGIDPRNLLKRTARGTLEVHPLTLAASLDGVFAAGDAVTGPGTVAQAVGSGRLAAVAIHHHLLGMDPGQGYRISLGGQGHLVFRPYAARTEQHVVQYEEMMSLESFEKRNRLQGIRLDTATAVASFEELDKGFAGDQAMAEADRCFHCGHCRLCGNCVEDCPGYVLSMTDEGPKVAYPEECWHCGNCRISCPSAAVSYEFPLSMLV